MSKTVNANFLINRLVNRSIAKTGKQIYTVILQSQNGLVVIDFEKEHPLE